MVYKWRFSASLIAPAAVRLERSKSPSEVDKTKVLPADSACLPLTAWVPTSQTDLDSFPCSRYSLVSPLMEQGEAMYRMMICALLLGMLAGCVQTPVHRDAPEPFWGHRTESDGTEYVRAGKLLIMTQAGES